MEKRTSPWTMYSTATAKPGKAAVIAVIPNPISMGNHAPGPMIPAGALKADSAAVEGNGAEKPMVAVAPIDQYPEKTRGKIDTGTSAVQDS
jgi:hypothetical protein